MGGVRLPFSGPNSPELRYLPVLPLPYLNCCAEVPPYLARIKLNSGAQLCLDPQYSCRFSARLRSRKQRTDTIWAMSRKNDAFRSREGLLDHQEPRRSSDENRRSSSDLDLDDLPRPSESANNRLRGGWLPTKWSIQPRMSSRERQAIRDQKHMNKTRRKGGCLRSRVCWVVTAVILSLVVGLAASAKWIMKKYGPSDGHSPPWYPTPKGGTLATWKESYEKAAMMVRNMSLVEKVNVTTGTGWATNLCVGNTGSAVRVGFPMLCLQDGPLGIRFVDNATVWPAGITVAATWSKDLMYQRGRGLGLEHRMKGVNVALAPCMGPLGRMPAGGRNWEGFGPDPVLAGIAAAQTIRGIQDQGVMATAKHYVGNEQEHFRQAWEWGIPNAISSNIDDRTLHELYLWPFADSVRAGVASIMCSYNMVNSSYACGNSKLMNGILKDELGFQGFVQSDWLAQRSGVASALSGLDMSMPGDGLRWNDRKPLWGPKLTEAALNRSVPIDRINDMVTRIVAAWYKLKQDNRTAWPLPPPDGEGGPNFSSFTKEKIGRVHQDTGDKTTAHVNKFVDVQGNGSKFHGRLAQQIAAEGTVLVKNSDGILPLSPDGAKDLTGNSKYRVGIYGEDAGPNPDGPNSCPDRSCNVGTLAQGWGSGAADYPFLITPIEALQTVFSEDRVQVHSVLINSLAQNDLLEASRQDLCLVFINSDAGEGFASWDHLTDRNDLYSQKNGDQLVESIADRCNKTIVIVHAVGPVIVERWADHPNVKAIILANLPGEESGNALVDVLFGKVDASGRLPYTVGRSLADYGPGGQVMYKPTSLSPQQNFKERLLIDYRYFDAKSIAPRYEFGFGLSYTTFSYSNLSLKTLKVKSPLPAPRPDPALEPPIYPTSIPDSSEAVAPSGFSQIDRYIYPYIPNTTVSTGPYPYPSGYHNAQNLSPAGGGEGGNPSLYENHLAVSVEIANTGDRDGMEVVQLYVSFPPAVDASTGEKIQFPDKVLRAFEKIEIEKGKSEFVELKLTRRDLSYWSVGMQNWVMPDGTFHVHVGTSSRNLPLNATW